MLYLVSVLSESNSIYSPVSSTGRLEPFKESFIQNARDLLILSLLFSLMGHHVS